MEDKEKMYADIQRLNTESLEFKRRLETLESNDKRHEDDIRTLFVTNKGIEVMQTQIMTRFDAMETKMFNYMSQIQTTFAQTQQNELKDRKDERKDKSSSLKQVFEFAKYVIMATIGAAIAYWFKSGGSNGN